MAKTKSQQELRSQEVLNTVQTGLTPIQEQAAILLASGETITAVAATIGVNRSTLYEWQDIVTFQCFLNQQRADYQEQLKNGIFGLTSEALATLKGCLQSENEPTRLKAATWLLERIASQKTGITDVREALRRKHTKFSDNWEDYNKFDKVAYENDCRQLGIDPEL
ncbi:MAG: hypothetical protein GX993_05345 [Bacteroidales bacterium]|nr:hypothetical protein [Bacteroidales bacterium]